MQAAQRSASVLLAVTVTKPVRQRDEIAGGGVWSLWVGVSPVDEPLSATDEPSVAAAKMPTVAICMRFGVSQEACCA